MYKLLKYNLGKWALTGHFQEPVPWLFLAKFYSNNLKVAIYNFMSCWYNFLIKIRATVKPKARVRVGPGVKIQKEANEVKEESLICIKAF